MRRDHRVVLFAAGGTAGHVFPALAVADALTAMDDRLQPVFVGTRDRLEGRLIPQAGYRLCHIDVLPVPRRLTLEALKLPAALHTAVKRCLALIAETRATAAVTFGGYVSFPAARAAHRADLPLIVHEQNSVPGLANRVAARWADRIAVTFPTSANRFLYPERVVVTGNPVRREILGADQQARRRDALRRFQLQARRRTVLVFGGSQGARSLNHAAVASYGLWQQPDRVQVLHVAGARLFPETAAAWENARHLQHNGPRVHCVDFIEDMSAAYAVADVVVCRSGATSLAELTALGKPSVLVPYPYATGDHQRHNAEALQRAGAARLLLDDELTGESLVAAVEPLLLDDQLRASVARTAQAFGRRDAARNVARLLVHELEETAA